MNQRHRKRIEIIANYFQKYRFFYFANKTALSWQLQIAELKLEISKLVGKVEIETHKQDEGRTYYSIDPITGAATKIVCVVEEMQCDNMAIVNSIKWVRRFLQSSHKIRFLSESREQMCKFLLLLCGIPTCIRKRRKSLRNTLHYI